MSSLMPGLFKANQKHKGLSSSGINTNQEEYILSLQQACRIALSDMDVRVF